MSGGGSRVSIPTSVRKTIENIKEITGNHSDDEIYAMLRECSMDPNETTQKLLLQDTFHEVKSKRERRKENANNRESVETRWKTGMQGRGGRGGRINSSPRYISHDAGGGRNPGPGKENGVNPVIEKGGSLSMPTSQETKNKEKIPVTSSLSVGNGATSVASGSVAEVTSSLADNSGKGTALPPINANKNPNRVPGTRPSSEQPIPNSDDGVVPIALASSSSALSSSSSDPSSESLPGSVDAIKCDGGSSLHPNEPSTANPVENKLIPEALEISNSLAQENHPIKSPKMESQLNEISPPSVSMQGSSTVSLPSNYNKRPQQVIGPHKASSNKEWKPKPTSSVVIQQSRTISAAAAASEVPAVTFDDTNHLEPASRVLDSEEATLTLQKKLEELHVSKSQLVILPNHIQVPESERSKLSFGSFGIGFGVSSTVPSGPESDQRHTPASEVSVDADENVEEEASSYSNALRSTEDVDSPDRPQSPAHMPENLSPTGGDLSSSTIQEYNDLKQETGLPSGGQTNSVAQTSSSYSFGFISPVVGSQIAAVENSDTQGRDASRLPSFVVQQPFDPSSYYAQFYRSGENDGRLSPFLSPGGVATKYNGNVALMPPSSSQSPQEGVVLTTAGPTALLTQAAGLMQSSIAVTQQPMPVFRPPAGVHISHYPPNYLPYGHYFSPFYVPPPPIHQFVGNNAFPQQAQGGNIYPAPPAANAAVKYSIPQYKMGANSGNSSHIGVPSGYGPYGSSASGYSPSTAAPAGNTTANEDLGASQFKENSVYITGPQSDGSAVWIGAPGRDMSSLPANSFYNLPPQGQHVTFTPTQTGHGTFASIYHPAQAVTAGTVHPLLQQSQAVAGGVDTVGPGGSIYQQPQHSQINWPSNY